VDVLGLSFGGGDGVLKVEERGKVRSVVDSVAQYTVVINTEAFEEMMNSADVVEADEGKKKEGEVGGRGVVLRVSGCVFRGCE
jgi:hypothetical protein